MAFELRLHRREADVVLALSGELDMATAPHVTSCVAELLAGGDSRVLVELDELTFCDSAGLNAFISCDRQCAGVGGWLRVTGAGGHVARVLELSGVLEVLTYRPDAGLAQHGTGSGAPQPDDHGGPGAGTAG